MQRTLTPSSETRNRHRQAVTPAARFVARRWRMPLPTAAAVAEAAGLHGGDR